MLNRPPWQCALLWAITSLTLHAETIPFPSYDQLASGPQQVRLLPGQREFVFTMYGTPGDLDQLKQLVKVMTEKRLGNGFDPGPAARAASKPLFEYLATVGWPVIAYPGCADMQIKGGRCVLRPEDQAALSALDQAAVFNAIQLGEWGYYLGVEISENLREIAGRRRGPARVYAVCADQEPVGGVSALWRRLRPELCPKLSNMGIARW